MSTTSGPSSAASAMAGRPSWASPTTSRSSAPVSAARTPSRNSGWSSTSRIRVIGAPPSGQDGPDARAAPDRCRDDEPAADLLGPPGIDDPEPDAGGVRSDTDTVVLTVRTRPASSARSVTAAWPGRRLCRRRWRAPRPRSGGRRPLAAGRVRERAHVDRDVEAGVPGRGPRQAGWPAASPRSSTAGGAGPRRWGAPRRRPGRSRARAEEPLGRGSPTRRRAVSTCSRIPARVAADAVVQLAPEPPPLLLAGRHQGLPAALELLVELQRRERRGGLVGDAPRISASRVEPASPPAAGPHAADPRPRRGGAGRRPVASSGTSLPAPPTARRSS